MTPTQARPVIRGFRSPSENGSLRPRSARDLYGEQGRAAATDERGDIVPVDLIREFRSEQSRNAEPPQLVDAPFMDSRVFVVAYLEADVTLQRRLHRFLRLVVICRKDRASGGCCHRGEPPFAPTGGGSLRLPASRNRRHFGRVRAQISSSHVHRVPVSPNASSGVACDADEVPLRCLIVDDKPAFLEAAAALLRREGLTVVGVASTSDDAVRKARELLPDVVLVDIFLDGESGFDLARRLTENSTGLAIVLISTHEEADFADLIAETPAAGFVPKSELSAQAIRKLVDGR